MSQQYEYLETSLNYAENEENEAFTEFDNNVQEELPEEQTMEADVDVTEEQNIENETSKLRYQDADALIQAEIKEIIYKKETEKTTLKVFNEQRNNIMQQIKDLQDLRDIVGEENRALNINIEIEKDEMLNLQKRVAYNGEIVGRLEEFIKTIENSFKQLKSRNEQYSANLINQRNKILNCYSQNASRISQLKADINNKKKSNVGVNTDPKRTENLLLKSKIIEKQEYLKHLKERYQQIELKKQSIRELIIEKEKTENILKDKSINLQILNDTKNKNDVNTNALIKELDKKKEERNKSLIESRQLIESINKEITEVTTVKDSLCNDILLNEDHNSQLDEKISKITADIKDQQVVLDEYMEKCKQDINIAQDKLQAIRNDLTDISNEDCQLSSSLELVRQEYIAKIEEKGNNLLLKLELEKKLSSDEIFLTNIKLLEEQITLKKKTPEELLEKIQRLSTDDAVQDLTKKKAYLISSTDYLNEKLENVKTQLGDAKRVLDDLQADIDSSAKSNREKQETCDALLEELQEQKREVVDEYQLNTTPTSILKSTTLSSKKLPVSPKKVQFEGVSSYDSSASSEPVTLSSSSQRTIVGKTFDDILEEIHAESFKTPLKLPKKRKVDIDID